MDGWVDYITEIMYSYNDVISVLEQLPDMAVRSIHVWCVSGTAKLQAKDVREALDGKFHMTSFISKNTCRGRWAHCCIHMLYVLFIS